MQEMSPSHGQSPRLKMRQLQGGTDKWNPQKTELAVSWNTLLLIRLLQGRIDTGCAILDKSSQPGFFLGFFCSYLYSTIYYWFLYQYHTMTQVHHDPGIPKEGGFQWVFVLSVVRFLHQGRETGILGS